MGGQWPVWRLVLAQVATLHEVEEHWTYGDVLRANMALDVQAAAQPKPKRGGK